MDKWVYDFYEKNVVFTHYNLQQKISIFSGKSSNRPLYIIINKNQNFLGQTISNHKHKEFLR